VLFAFATTAMRGPRAAEVTVYAPDNRRSREFLREDLGLALPWHEWADFGKHLQAAVRPFDLVVVGTFPPAAGMGVVERALDAGWPVLALVHDIDYFARRDGAQAALERWPRLMVGFPGAAPARPVASFPAPVRSRITRFLPVVDFGAGGGTAAAGDRQRAGVGLPGTIEFSRRDFPGLLRLTAQTGIPLRIFGRSRQSGEDPVVAGVLAADRRRLLREIGLAGASPYVSVSLDPSSRDFYRAVDSCRFIAIVPVSDAYLRGKLTGAVTAAVSCCVPMVADRLAYACYAGAMPEAFSGCMVQVGDHPAGWKSVVAGTTPAAYEELCLAARRARTLLLDENTATLHGAMTILGGRYAG